LLNVDNVVDVCVWWCRRLSALLWDVKHIVGNAKKFNEDGTPISRSAAIVTETLVRFIR
jgi:bromodomain and WD repeat domain-containing protein 1/3